MRILVTGANGFLGFRLVRQLLLSGETNICCLIRSAQEIPRLRSLGNEFAKANLEISIGDLTSKDDVRSAAADVEVLYHLAAAMRGSPADMFLNTVVGSKNLLDELVKNRLERAILVSSLAVYSTADLPDGAVITEDTPLEPHPEKRGTYCQAKLRQERLFRDYQSAHGFHLVTVRPGVVYGPLGPRLSARIGVNLFGVLLHFGANNLLPLTYVDNCAAAVAAVGQREGEGNEVFNIVDDELPTANEYLKGYRQNVERLRYLRVPYFVLQGLSRFVEKYHAHSKGQLPLAFTPYKSASLWRGNRLDNSKLKSTGWTQGIPTREGMQRTFAAMREEAHASG
jgi:nucleoside-diphosphate-sugar epimerase